MRLIQFRDDQNRVAVAALDGNDGWHVRDAGSVYALALQAIRDATGLADLAHAHRGNPVDLLQLAEEGRLLAPIAHPDPAHCHLAGTGLTHLGSAEGRDQMHKAASGGHVTDSMRMFLMGVEGGKTPDGSPGVQPEWFYKGDGTALIGPDADLPSPDFALDGSEEPEIAGIYIIGDDGTPYRLGFALANEFSDHITERGNYLWLAHSKLRHASLGAELLLGDLPADIQGTSRIVRDGETLWEKPFLSGEANMSHSIANLEHHHFKYGLFRQPGDVHVHFFGTATLSFADNVETREGDMFEVSAPPFAVPLRNKLKRMAPEKVEVKAL